MDYYHILKFLHILSDIIAVGFSASYMLWIWRASSDPGKLAYILQGIRFLDSRITNPAFLLIVISGLSMALLSGYPLTSIWIAGAIFLFLAVALLGMLIYAPAFRRLRLAAENPLTQPAELKRLVRRAFGLNLIVGTLVLAILGLMVFKP